jgi:WD40 repeat protein
VWDTTTGEPLLTLTGHITDIYGAPSSDVFGVAFSPDGTRLATSGGDGTARIYVLPIEDLIALARTRVNRSLTDAECRQFLHVEVCPGSS